MRLPRRSTNATLLLAMGMVIGCGRSPVWLPCNDNLASGPMPSLSCEHPSCASSTGLRLAVGADNVLIVQDRSCSMAEVIEGRTKWSRAVEAVVQTVSDPRASTVRWGLSLFPDGITDGMQGPILVPVGDGQSGAIAQLMTNALDRDDPNHPQQPGEGCFTNLADATGQVADSRVFADLDGRSHVVLITDGFANLGFGDDEAPVISDLQMLYERDVPTFVVGFGERVDPETLEALAEAGGVPAPGTGYYRAGLDDLGGALSEVLFGLRCRQEVEIPLEDVPRLVVSWFDGMVIPNDATNGWRYDQDQPSLVFTGWPCEQLLTGQVSGIDLDLDCG